jgi:hypothetical protein
MSSFSLHFHGMECQTNTRSLEMLVNMELKSLSSCSDVRLLVHANFKNVSRPCIFACMNGHHDASRSALVVMHEKIDLAQFRVISRS